MKNCIVVIYDDFMFEFEEQFRVYFGYFFGNYWSGVRVGKNNMVIVIVFNDEDGNRRNCFQLFLG